MWPHTLVNHNTMLQNGWEVKVLFKVCRYQDSPGPGELRQEDCELQASFLLLLLSAFLKRIEEVCVAVSVTLFPTTLCCNVVSGNLRDVFLA